ncbi:protease pro-enzyme activation domain-containing protein [Edaphobacter sp. 12200R-103]|uniref:S53 family peptidase n=1 Tax=Edaphobacter sp. 12200R-103 TaxID=2703788 RepID=UPI00138C2797|nr:S53 family peptidase [Edaphobacter sp. 12200R-103]QHS51311.1 S8/S53 family peptidase [Edaphobacter sp. 12200R-103]
MSIRNRLRRPHLLVPVLAVLGSLVSFAHAAPQNRISRQITDSDRASVRETVPVRARLSADLGEAADQQLPAVSLYFNMTDAEQADLTQLLQDQQNPASPHYHQWLTPQQYGARFGLTDADLQKVQAWLTSRGMKIVEVAPSRNYVTVSGSFRQVEAAFRTSIHSVSFQGQRHFSNLSDPQLPTPIASLVTAITGLNDFKPRAHSIAKAHFTSATSGAHFMAPGDFYAIYDVNPLLTQGFDGSGITIAIVGQTDISLSDVAAFRSAAGLPAKAPQVTQATGYVAGKVSGDLDEAQLDVEWAGAVAPNATVNFVTVGASNSASVVNALSFAITNNLAPIISMSYGNYEDAWGQSNIDAINQMLQQANAQGMTVIVASGDSGATDHDTAPPAKNGLAVDFPGSSPYATSAGGTMFNEGSATGGTSYWNSASGTDNVSSAKGYIPEAVWNESSSSGLSSGGGGVSRYNTKPAWQQGLTPDDGYRDVPDISLNAASNHDGYLFCSQGSCVNGFRTSTGTLNVVGGTSAVSPTLAGIFALLQQKLGGGTAARLGNINPMIYALGSSQYYGNVFHDITTGNNNSACQAGTTDCPNGGSIGYSASAGYDLATGWGSIDVAELVNKWGLVSPVTAGTNPDFTLTPTSTSISLNAGATSEAIPLSVTSTNNFNGPITFGVSADPSIAATFSFSTTTVNVSAGSSAQTTLIITAAKTSASAKVEKDIPTHLYWYAGSTASLAGVFFLFGPRRRRLSAWLVITLMIGVSTISGCGGGSSGISGNTSGNSGNSGNTTTTVNATPGTYTLYVSAAGGNGIVHTSTVTLTIK